MAGFGVVLGQMGEDFAFSFGEPGEHVLDPPSPELLLADQRVGHGSAGQDRVTGVEELVDLGP